ncbi:MAG: hypothetical protein LBE91_14745 [Tannerella sp.]|jgi:hypothetical protein|nr:hypothetical protein [Tannerella sp.]
MIQTLATIFSWFETGDFPTEQQFRDTFSSFWHKHEKIPYSQISDGFNEVTTLQDFPTDKSLIVVTLTADTPFSPAGGTVKNHMTIIIKNEATIPVTVTLPTSAEWVNWDGTQIDIPAGGLAEMNVVKADVNYIMFKVKNQ